MLYYLKRLCNDKFKLFVMLVFVSIPFFEILVYLRNIKLGLSVTQPEFAVFLAGNTAGYGHLLQGIALWFLPLYLLILNVEDILQDARSGNRNILVMLWGKKKYMKINMVKGFFVSFALVFITLMINYFMVHLIFRGGTHSPYNVIDANGFMKWSILHPQITNLGYMIVTSLLAGISGCVAALLSIACPKRQVVYPVVFLLWFVPCILKKSLMFLTQPFTEYQPKDMMPALCLFLIANLIAAIISWCREAGNGVV